MKVSVTVQGEGGTLFGAAPARLATEIKLSDGYPADEVERIVPVLTSSVSATLAAMGVQPIVATVSDGDDDAVGTAAQPSEGADENTEAGPNGW